MSIAVAERPAAASFGYAEYCQLPETERFEVIEGGKLPMAPAPSAAHQIVSANLFDILRAHARTQGGLALAAPLDVILDQHNIVQPDLLYLAPERKTLLQARGVFGAPDLIVEIVSPSSQHRDFVVKHRLYRRFGVSEYWIVNPGLETIDILTLEDGAYALHLEASTQTAEATDRIATSKLLPSLRIPLETVFADIPKA